MNLADTALLLALFATVTTAWWAVPALTRARYVFGVAVPPDRAADPALTAIRDRYGRNVIVLGIGLAALTFLAGRFTDPVAALGTGATVLVAADLAVYALAGRAVRAAKADGDWYAGTRQGVIADLTFRTDPVRVPWTGLAPALAVVAATVAIGLLRAGSLPDSLPGMDGATMDGGPRVPTGFWTAANPVLAQVALTAATWLVLVAIVRSRPDIDAARPAATARRYRAYLQALVHLGLVTAVCANLTLAGIALRLWEILPATVLTTVAVFTPLVVAAVFAVRFELRVGTGGHRLPAAPDEEDEDTGLVQRDDDRHWHLGGLVYANGDDPAVLVHQRVGGSQWTLNLGHPVGRTTGILLAAAILAAVVLGAAGVIDLPETRRL
ncbi:Uncharacterized membrane protein [Glycomyces sambucus]|uniref:Uncharacterized membrane protein n=1 Tax=Glycomyces sambucus TaxID=380244 RepID=A0A1G9CQE3_9ACTN|nr:hypothetical protein [Glycomyces sambucus]SDK53685.1 Uncharacterized membrane protein [Glycomyces sambucus]